MTDKEARDRRRLRGDALTVFGALILGGLLAWALFWIHGVSQALEESNQARDALARQVQQLGGKPVAGKPGSRGAIGQTGAPGRTGASGTPGRDGVDGKDGKDGKPGPDSTEPGPTGPPGADATGAPGEPGKDGRDGVDGKDGRDGRDGQTCPDGYSLQPAKDDPDALVCRRDGAAQQEPEPSDTSKPGLLGLTSERRRWS